MKNTLHQMNSMDACKICMSIIVVSGHCHIILSYQPSAYIDFYELLRNCTVPFFFLSTGYLVARKMFNVHTADEKHLIITKTLKKTLRLFALWTIIYLPLAIYDACTNDFPLFQDIINYFILLVTLGWHYNSWMLWYLLSSMYALIMILTLIKRNFSIIQCVIAGSCFYLFGQFLDTIDSIQYISDTIKDMLGIMFPNTIIFKGFLYIPLGMLLFQYNKFSKFKGGLIFLIATLLWLTLCNSYPFLQKDVAVLASTGLFIFVNSIILNDNKIYYKLRTASKFSYFTHLWIWSIVCAILYGKITYGIEVFIITLVITLSLAIIYIKYFHNQIRGWF